jgi:hypothetical protein
MGKSALHGLAGVVLYTGVTITWSPYHSTVYDYTISQPSSYRHLVIQTAPDQRDDYFYPSLGSSTTNVNVSATRGHTLEPELQYLRSRDGKNVHRSAWVSIVGRKLPLMCADFNSLVGKYRLEQVSFMSGGRVWRVTASYDLRFQNQRSIMLRMIKSFKLH